MWHRGGVPLWFLSQMLDLVAGMTALATTLIQMRNEETGMASEVTVAEVGRRIQELLPGCDESSGLLFAIDRCLVHQSIRSSAGNNRIRSCSTSNVCSFIRSYPPTVKSSGVHGCPIFWLWAQSLGDFGVSRFVRTPPHTSVQPHRLSSSAAIYLLSESADAAFTPPGRSCRSDNCCRRLMSAEGVTIRRDSSR